MCSSGINGEGEGGNWLTQVPVFQVDLDQYQNVFILDFIGTRLIETCNVPVPPTNQHPDFYRLDALSVAQPSV